MANELSKIQIGSTLYDLKDAYARTQIEALKNIKGLDYKGPVAYDSAGHLSDGMTITQISSGGTVNVNYIMTGPSAGYGWGTPSNITLQPLESGMLFTDKKTVGGQEREMEYAVTVETTSIGGVETKIATFHEFGSTGALKALAFKDSATVTGTAASHTHTYQKAKIATEMALQQGTVTSSGTFTPAGTNASSAVTLSGGSTKKYKTTSVTGTNGTQSVSKVTKTSKKLATTSIKGVSGTTSVLKSVSGTMKSLATTTLKGVSGTSTVHDTPTLNKSAIGSASGWSAGTMFSASVSGETLTLTAGTAPSLTITSTQVGTSLTAGTEKTFATANTEATTVATGGFSDTSASTMVCTGLTPTSETVATADADTTTVATGAVADSDANGASIISDVSITDYNVAKAASSATTVVTSTEATGSESGITVATALPTGGTAAAQTFTGTQGNVSVSGTSNTTIKTKLALGYDTENSGAASPAISGTAS